MLFTHKYLVLFWNAGSVARLWKARLSGATQHPMLQGVQKNWDWNLDTTTYHKFVSGEGMDIHTST